VRNPSEPRRGRIGETSCVFGTAAKYHSDNEASAGLFGPFWRRTTLCAELPLSVEESLWQASDEELASLVAQDLETAGIPLPCAPDWIHARRIRQAYPIYLRGYEKHLDTLDVSG
jgi:hypothetical protein